MNNQPRNDQISSIVVPHPIRLRVPLMITTNRRQHVPRHRLLRVKGQTKLIKVLSTSGGENVPFTTSNARVTTGIRRYQNPPRLFPNGVNRSLNNGALNCHPRVRTNDQINRLRHAHHPISRRTNEINVHHHNLRHHDEQRRLALANVIPRHRRQSRRRVSLTHNRNMRVLTRNRRIGSHPIRHRQLTNNVIRDFGIERSLMHIMGIGRPIVPRRLLVRLLGLLISNSVNNSNTRHIGCVWVNRLFFNQHTPCRTSYRRRKTGRTRRPSSRESPSVSYIGPFPPPISHEPTVCPPPPCDQR